MKWKLTQQKNILRKLALLNRFLKRDRVPHKKKTKKTSWQGIKYSDLTRHHSNIFTNMQHFRVLLRTAQVILVFIHLKRSRKKSCRVTRGVVWACITKQDCFVGCWKDEALWNQVDQILVKVHPQGPVVGEAKSRSRLLKISLKDDQIWVHGCERRLVV